MADRYLIETSATDGYQLEDGSGVVLLEQPTMMDAWARETQKPFIDAKGAVPY